MGKAQKLSYSEEMQMDTIALQSLMINGLREQAHRMASGMKYVFWVVGADCSSCRRSATVALGQLNGTRVFSIERSDDGSQYPTARLFSRTFSKCCSSTSTFATSCSSQNWTCRRCADDLSSRL